MKSARLQFILVGFLCQGLAWETALYWPVVIGAWALTLIFLRKRITVGPNIELGALIGGSALSYLLCKWLGQSSHFFLGDGITCLQLARCLRPLSRREKLVSVMMACFQVAVACTLAPDVRFLLLALSALILFPKSLIELQSEEFGQTDSRLEWTALIPLTLITISIFVSVPRVAVGAPIQMGSGPQHSEGLLSSVLDPASGGSANSSQVLLQIEGKAIRYLKCMALSQFDGKEWRVDEHLGLRRFRRAPDEELASYPHRRVRVKNVAFLGRILPTDGTPAAINGQFFQKPMLNTQGVIECMSVWNTVNNQYEYWIDPKPEIETLSPYLIRYFTQHPPASERLSQWLDQITKPATNQVDAAHRLELYLRRNYTYRIGAPALNRLDSLEDFLFEKREGHCERFASALALLLRMHNIPTRIGIGYVPGPQSRFSDWRQVRFKDAHAWTEAWFPDAGWMIFDATPGGGGGEDGFGVTQFLESLDLVWYSHVISFDGSSQREILTNLMGAMMNLPHLAQRNSFLALVLITAGAASIWWRRTNKLNSPGATAPARIATNADHFYGRLLRALAEKGIHRAPNQTPLEFLAVLNQQKIPHFEDIAQITTAFCETRYGEQPLSDQQASALEAALGRIREV